MNNESYTPEELQKAEMLDAAIDTLRQSKTAQANTAASSDIDPVFMERLQSNLLERFAQKKQSPWKLWKLFGIPTATIAVLTVGVVAAMKPELFTTNKNTATQVATDTSGTGAINATTNTLTQTNSATTGATNTNTQQGTTSTTSTSTDDFPVAEGQLASVEPDLADLNTLNQDMQSTMDDLDDILDSLESLEALNADTAAASQDIDTLTL